MASNLCWKPASVVPCVLSRVRTTVPASDRTPANVNMATRDNTVKSVNGAKDFHVDEKCFSRFSEHSTSLLCLLIDALPEGVLSGPNVCEREEMREEVVRVMEQELVETTIKEWCWPKIRCQKTKMEPMSVEKLQKMIKPHRVRYCCDGFAQNFIGNRCIAVQYVDDSQQQINQQ